MPRKFYAKPGRPARHLVAQRELAINLSWKTVLEYLQDPKADMKHKVEIAKSICVKAMPTQIEGEKELAITIINASDQYRNTSPRIQIKRASLATADEGGPTEV